MANDFLTAQSGPIAQVALQTLYRQIVLPMLVWRDFSTQVAGQGATVTIRKPATLTARRYTAAMRTAGTPITLDDVTEDGIPVILDTHSYSAVAIPDEDEVLEIQNFATQVLAPQTKAVAEDLEDVVAAVFTGATTTAEVQTVTITGTPTGGNFTLTFRGATTANIAHNATAATVLTRLNALSTISEGDVAVGGGPGPGTPYTVTFDPDMGDVPQMTAAHTFTGGTTPNVAVTTTTPGAAGSIGEVTVSTFDGTAANDPALDLIDGWEMLTENKVPNNANRFPCGSSSERTPRAEASMALPALASLGSLRVWVTITQASDTKCTAALASASALVRSYTDRPTGWVNPGTGQLDTVPDPVVEATINVARRRAVTPDDGTTDESAGPFSVKRDTGLWLSATDKLLLDHYRHSAGVTSMTTRGVFGAAEDLVTVPDGLPGSDPIPWE
ncbi:MAG: hypothetical protein ACRDSL_04395 [Pseudonocardiaceae bacterium]